jgi:hypothetical protein
MSTQKNNGEESKEPDYDEDKEEKRGELKEETTKQVF